MSECLYCHRHGHSAASCMNRKTDSGECLMCGHKAAQCSHPACPQNYSVGEEDPPHLTESDCDSLGIARPESEDWQ